tara:strand:- start:36983 stop:42601 length:5619 start_codon:yes stop_codon:yes gene_type:complete
MRARSPWFLGLLGLVLVVTQSANATVTQVDGTIIPVSGSRVQAELDIREAATGTLDAVLDAAELPEVFLPNTTQDVTFTDFAEYAGFENSFGYYNVGDDISSAAGRRENLHPIIGCGVSMENHAFDPGHSGHHHGDPTMYIEDALPGNPGPGQAAESVAVDFAAEQAAGRYKGGFIGFYLITPEDRPGGVANCGDFEGDSFFAFIYFTQKDLNDDGDFVHHLVYSSPSNADRFYFGFEDLFRGGDNDFADMMIEVDGLAPPCIPSTEVCDGIDNDCDGLVDAADADLFGVGDSCQCDDVALTCADGPTFGVCQEGETICVAGAIECTSIGGPSSEVCDGLDNDCNNNIDDSPADVGAACDGPDSDLCPEGFIVCESGALECDDDTGPNAEFCDNVDNDCDGPVDESPVDEGGVCGSGVGQCSPGVEVCIAGGVLDCQGEVGPTDELCNGLDDDCDGVEDDAPIDVGGDCGATDVGPCEFGTLICNAGSPQCAGEVGPQTETCNLIDDDCNSTIDNDPIDVGSPCGTNVGVCEPGVIECTATGPECVDEVSGGPELCNGLDDDCNGLVDDNPAGVDVACGESDGLCEPGLVKCISGALECVGGFDGTTEVCNGVDDDCNDVIDDGDLCEGGACIDGACTSPCDGGEFSCPVGQGCIDNFCVPDACFGVICNDDEDGTRNVCREGSCEPICDAVDCPSDLVCRPSDGVCVPETCTFLPLCAEDEICLNALCESDPCFDITCGDSEFCRGGDCIASCVGIQCDEGQQCIDGLCEATGCSGDCPDRTICDAASGECIDDPCRNIGCPEGQVCDPQAAECIADPCIGVECPADAVCEFGGCYDAPEDTSGDAGPVPEYVAPGGGGGCSVGASSQGTGLWFGLALLGLLLWRRRGSAVNLVPLVCLLAAPQAACDANPFCINCDEGGQGNGDGGVDIFDGGPGDAGFDAAPGCEDGVVRQEICDELDNDCDGNVDEDTSLATDFFNCGSCGNSCERGGTRTACESGACVATECFPGNVDVNGDLGDPFEGSDGCEYGCFVSNAGEEACDELDNDCDGVVDEATNFDSDLDNCGQCGRVCGFFEASPTCSAGTCSFDPASDCTAGFIDSNGMQADGCEYSCTPTDGGVESCDLVDNDCDGDVDEDFDTDTDVNHCGQCGRVCSFPNASASCTTGACTFNPAADCDTNFHDVNGTVADGCEYSCTPSNGGVEICDLIDNDCNGVADDAPEDAGLACNNGPMGIAIGACENTGNTVCSLGTIVCVGAPEPSAETCNNIDDNCDGNTDEDVSRSCYSGPGATEGVGLCASGSETCSAGVFGGACVGEVLPATEETCDNQDEDCDAQIDEATAGGPLVQSCYSGTAGTAGAGECLAGEQSCTFGVFGSCQGEVVDQIEICGDGLDSDCDTNSDAVEGCLIADASDERIDASGALGTNAGEEHSFDLVIAAGGSPLGERVYASWADLSNGNSDIYFARSLDGGATWQDAINLTDTLGNAAVKPFLVVSPGATDSVHVVYQSVSGGVRDIRTQNSTDSGATFTAPSGALDGADDSFHHSAAVSDDGNEVAIVWEELDTSTLDRNIISRTSTDAGASYEAQRTVNVGSGASPIAGRPQVGITSADRYIFVWREIRSGVTSDAFSAFSDSATAAIAPANETRLDADIGDEENADLPVLRVVGTAAYVTWQSISTVPGAGSDVVFVRSADAGATFGAEIIIDDPVVERSSSFGPVMAVDAAGAGTADDRVFLAWEDRREGTQVFATSSADGGQTFDAAQRASSNAGAPLSGVTRGAKLVYAGGDILVISYMNAGADGVEHAFAASSIDAGASWDFTHEALDTGAGAALNPVITNSDDAAISTGACIGWVDFRAGTGINGDPYVRRVGQ